MRVCLSERTIKPNNGFITKHGAIIESRVNEMECTMNSLGNIAKHGAIFNYHYYTVVVFSVGVKNHFLPSNQTPTERIETVLKPKPRYLMFGHLR